MKYQILQGDNRDTLKTIADNSIDAIVTDPPYGIDFLGKSWDANTGALETYQECLRVLKPGGHILAFSAARTYHHLAITLEQAGFEIRDQIMWIYSSGFPKSQDIGKSIDRAAGKKDPNYGTTNNNGTKGGINLSFTEDHIGGSRRCNKCKKDVAAQYDCKDDDCGMIYKPQTDAGKQWAGWGTALKPAHEPICMARKPMKLSIAKNAQKWGTGALNIDATRIAYENDYDAKHQADIARGQDNATNGTNFFGTGKSKSNLPTAGNRTSSFHNATGGGETQSGGDGSGGWEANTTGRFPSNVIGEIEQEYQKYFYCPKVSRKERHTGFELSKVPVNEFNDPSKVKDHPLWDESIGSSVSRLQDKIRKMNPEGNNHPTVKPVALMKYLIKLVTPPNGIVLDPFNGSGSTGMAAVELGYEYIGCELDPNYVEIAKKRIEAWNRKDTAYDELFQNE